MLFKHTYIKCMQIDAFLSVYRL